MSEAIFGIQPDDIEACVRRIEKASDNYAKLGVLEEFGVEWGDRKKALWALISAGHYEAWNDPAIWYELSESVELATTDVLVTLLQNIETYDAESSGESDDYDDSGYDGYAYDDYGDHGGYEEPAYESPRLVSFWPQYLDDLAMHAYAADADLVEARLSEFHPDVQKGMKLVKKRFGKLDGEVPGETLEELAQTHVWNSLPWRVYDVEDGELVELVLGSSDEKGPENQKRFISYFADEDEWAEAVLESVFSRDYGPSFASTLPAWPVANLEQIEWMLDKISIYNQDRVTTNELLLAREDSVEDLLNVASSLMEDSKEAAAEMATIAAVHRAKALGEGPPEKGLQYITFQSIDNVSKRADYFALPLLVEALRAYDADAVRPRFKEAFKHKYLQLAPMPAVSAFADDRALLELAFDTVEKYAASEERRFSAMNKAALGLGLLGPEGLEPLASALDSSEEPLARDTFRRAIIGVLADTDGPQDERYDEYVTLQFDSTSEQTNERDLGHYVLPDYRAALANMDEERAATCVARELDEDHWYRAFGALPKIANPELLDRAFGAIARSGLPPGNEYNWFQPVLRELREESKPFIGPALAASDSPELHNAIKSSYGEEEYQRMLDEAGGESAADKGKAGKIQRLSNAWFEANPDAERTVIYVMERGDEEPEEGTLNRIGGRPFGVTSESWPSKDTDTPMHHMVTIDLDTMPAYHSFYKEDIRGFSLYVNSPGHNQAWTPGNPDSEVDVIRRDDVKEFEGELPVGDEKAVGFTVEEVEVPVDAFTVPYDGNAELRAIRGAIYSASAWGGGAGPIWLQGDEHFGAFVMQFDEGFVHMNLGDAGIMYVFSDTAFWQCH